TLCMSNEVIVAAASTSAIDCFPRTINNYRVQLFRFGELLIRNDLDAYRPDPAKEARRLFLVALLVPGGHDEEEAVVRDAQESPGVEERIIGAGQPVQCEHPVNRSEGRKKDGELENDRNRGFDGEEGLAADDDRVVDGVHPPLEPQAEERARDTAAKRHVPHLRVPEAHRPVHAVDREGAVDVEMPVSRAAYFFRRFVESSGIRKLGQEAVDRPGWVVVNTNRQLEFLNQTLKHINQAGQRFCKNLIYLPFALSCSCAGWTYGTECARPWPSPWSP